MALMRGTSSCLPHFAAIFHRPRSTAVSWQCRYPASIECSGNTRAAGSVSKVSGPMLGLVSFWAVSRIVTILPDLALA